MLSDSKMSLCFVLFTAKHAVTFTGETHCHRHSTRNKNQICLKQMNFKNETPKIHTLRLSDNQITDGKKKKMIGIINEKKKITKLELDK